MNAQIVAFYASQEADTDFSAGCQLMCFGCFSIVDTGAVFVRGEWLTDSLRMKRAALSVSRLPDLIGPPVATTARPTMSL